MSGRSLLNFVDNAVAVVANVGMNLLLIPRFGAVGAAVAWSAAIVGLNAVRMLQVWWVLRISPLSRSLLRPMVALLCALIATWVVRPAALAALPAPAGVLVLAICFGTIYAGSLAVLGLYPEDRMLIRAIVRPGRLETTLDEVTR
jgi:O-antigen/teichoic acid export membrane protein